jgi:hypothetical protein
MYDYMNMNQHRGRTRWPLPRSRAVTGRQPRAAQSDLAPRGIPRGMQSSTRCTGCKRWLVQRERCQEMIMLKLMSMYVYTHIYTHEDGSQACTFDQLGVSESLAGARLLQDGAGYVLDQRPAEGEAGG